MRTGRSGAGSCASLSAFGCGSCGDVATLRPCRCGGVHGGRVLRGLVRETCPAKASGSGRPSPTDTPVSRCRGAASAVAPGPSAAHLVADEHDDAPDDEDEPRGDAEHGEPLDASALPLPVGVGEERADGQADDRQPEGEDHPARDRLLSSRRTPQEHGQPA